MFVRWTNFPQSAFYFLGFQPNCFINNSSPNIFPKYITWKSSWLIFNIYILCPVSMVSRTDANWIIPYHLSPAQSLFHVAPAVEDKQCMLHISSSASFTQMSISGPLSALPSSSMMPRCHNNVCKNSLKTYFTSTGSCKNKQEESVTWLQL